MERRELERKVVRVIVEGNSCSYYLLGNFGIDVFQDTKNRIIVEGALSLSASGRAISPSALYERLLESGQAERVKDYYFALIEEALPETTCEVLADMFRCAVEADRVRSAVDWVISSSELCSPEDIVLEILRGVGSSVYSLSELRDQFIQILKRPGIETGIPDLDRYFRVPESGVFAVAGSKGAGKTSFLYSFAVHLVRKNVPFFFVSSEHKPAEIYGRLLSGICGEPVSNLPELLESSAIGNEVILLEASSSSVGDISSIWSLASLIGAFFRSRASVMFIDGFDRLFDRRKLNDLQVIANRLNFLSVVSLDDTEFGYLCDAFIYIAGSGEEREVIIEKHYGGRWRVKVPFDENTGFFNPGGQFGGMEGE